MKNQVRLVIGGIIVLLLAIFSYLNRQVVSVHFGFGNVSMPLVLVIIVNILIGIVLAMIFTVGNIHKLRADLKDKNAQLDSLMKGKRSKNKEKITK